MTTTWRKQFPLFQTPLDLAHAYWQQLLTPGCHVIDATCGNGHDTLFLAKEVLQQKKKGRIILETAVQDDKVIQDFKLESFSVGGEHSPKVKAPPIENDYDSKDCVNLSPSTAVSRIIALDTQLQAIENTQTLLKDHLDPNLLEHVALYQQCHSSFPISIKKESIHLIVYNLGYLPGGNKTLTTLTSTTLESLNAALPLIAPGGAISITCYPGHEAGKPEEETVLAFSASLNPQSWSCCHHRWVNRRNAPSLILIQRSL